MDLFEYQNPDYLNAPDFYFLRSQCMFLRNKNGKTQLSKNSMKILTQVKYWLLNQLSEILEFQQRIWVVSICNSSATDTFIVNEDSFHEPMQWMMRKGYTEDMLQKINQLKRSQAVQLELNGISHQVLRVK